MRQCPASEVAGELAALVRASKLTIFAGSGISRFRPSELPIGSQMRDGLLDALAARHSAVAPYVPIVKARNPNPELVYQCMLSVMGESFFTSHDVLDAPGLKPNENHVFLAKLAERSWLKLVLTTNLDRLLEKAAVEMSISHSVRIRPADLSALAGEPPGIFTIAKLHGSAEDRGSLVLTLNQTGRGVTEAQQIALEAAVEDKAVLFLGYSGNDVDLYPALASLMPRVHGVYWNFRAANDVPADIRPLLSRADDRATLVIDDLRKVLAALARELKLDYSPPEDCGPATTPWVAATFHAWASRLNPEIAGLFFGEMLMELEEFTAAERLLAELSDGSPALLPNVLLASGQAHFAAGRWEEAGRAYEQARSLLSTSGARHWLCIIEERLGVLRRNQGRWGEAVASLQAARQLAERDDSPAQAAECLNHLGVAYQRKGDRDAAEGAYRESEALCRSIGHIRALAAVLTNRGTVLRQSGEPTLALAAYEEAARLFSKVGAEQNLAECHLDRGVALRDLGRVEESRKEYGTSLDIAERLGRPQLIAAVLVNVAAARYDAGERETVRPLLVRATDLCASVGDQEGLSNAIVNLAQLDADAGDLARSRESLERSLSIRVTLGHALGAAECRARLATLAAQAGDLESAMLLSERAARELEAVERFELAGDMVGFGAVLLASLGRFQDAYERTERAALLFRRLNVVSNVSLAELNLGFFAAEQGSWESARDHFDTALTVAEAEPTTVADLLRRIVGFSLAKARRDVAMAYASRLRD